ncbi:MAG TPA: beta-phosphoglucomutase [Candidatus Scatosoma pullicola]|nr:beta-phosphoglucomutase [Candidatus Scatosoma pullicola]
MKYKGVIFDLDGVICFTDELHYLAWKALADRLNIYFDREINQRMRGVSRMDSLNILLEKSDVEYSEVQKEAFAAEKNAIYADSLRKMSEKDVSDDVRQTLKTLREKGVKIALGSSSKNAQAILERIGLEEMFDAVSDGNGLEKFKPDPEVFLKAAEKLGLEPKDCLVVEDAVAGIDAGVAGGFATAGIGPAAGYDKAGYKIEKVSDILKISDL